MSTQQIVSSFVLRFSSIEEEESQQKHWRIKVTHVQGEAEASVSTMEEAVKFMRRILESGNE
jgi:hypothetical protein